MWYLIYYFILFTTHPNPSTLYKGQRKAKLYLHEVSTYKRRELTGELSYIRRQKVKKLKEERRHRKKYHRVLKDLSNNAKYLILMDFRRGLSVDKIAKKHRVNVQSLLAYYNKFYSDLVDMTESKKLSELHPEELGKVAATSVHNMPQLSSINAPFYEMLSPEDTEEMNEQEQLYCHQYALTGNNNIAMAASGLSIDLETDKKGKPKNPPAKHKSILRLRGVYLRNRGKINRAIRHLQEELVKDIHLDKSYIQLSILQNIEQLKEVVTEYPNMCRDLTKNIELLGKTIPNTFTETVNVQEVQPDKALDKLLELAKADVKQLEGSTDTDETWEYIDNNTQDKTGGE